MVTNPIKQITYNLQLEKGKKGGGAYIERREIRFFSSIHHQISNGGKL
jgi:hypothetical protein